MDWQGESSQGGGEKKLLWNWEWGIGGLKGTASAAAVLDLIDRRAQKIPLSRSPLRTISWIKRDNGFIFRASDYAFFVAGHMHDSEFFSLAFRPSAPPLIGNWHFFGLTCVWSEMLTQFVKLSFQMTLTGRTDKKSSEFGENRASNCDGTFWGSSLFFLLHTGQISL